MLTHRTSTTPPHVLTDACMSRRMNCRCHSCSCNVGPVDRAAAMLTIEVACISSMIAKALGATLGHILPGSSSSGGLRTAVNPPSSRKHCRTT